MVSHIMEYLPVIPWFFYEIPVDIRAIFFCIPRAFRRYFLKTHGITVLSYNYLIFSHNNAFYRQLTGVKRDFSNVCTM